MFRRFGVSLAEAGTHATFRKQLKALGCPVWSSGKDQHESTASTVCRLYLCSRDGGSDQILCSKMSKIELKDAPCDIFMETHCHEHLFHLSTGSGLVVVNRFFARWNGGDKISYYSGLAKIIHVWRQHAKLIYFLWAVRFGSTSANACARAMPPTCNAARCMLRCLLLQCCCFSYSYTQQRRTTYCETEVCCCCHLHCLFV